MAFMMDKMTMGQDFLLEILLSPIIYLLPVLHILSHPVQEI